MLILLILKTTQAEKKLELILPTLDFRPCRHKVAMFNINSEVSDKNLSYIK